MTTIAEITIDSTDLALAETFDGRADLEARVKRVAADGPNGVLSLLWIGGIDRSDLERALSSDPTVSGWTALLGNGSETEWLYRIDFSDDIEATCDAIFECEGTILDAQCTDGWWTLRLLFPDRQSLSRGMESLDESGIAVDVTRMVAADNEAGRTAGLDDPVALTDAQKEAIHEAYRRGYYDVPRSISLEDLADELEISHQALSERLRRANKVLAGEQVSDPRPDDAIAPRSN